MLDVLQKFTSRFVCVSVVVWSYAATMSDPEKPGDPAGAPAAKGRGAALMEKLKRQRAAAAAAAAAAQGGDAASATAAETPSAEARFDLYSTFLSAIS